MSLPDLLSTKPEARDLCTRLQFVQLRLVKTIQWTKCNLKEIFSHYFLTVLGTLCAKEANVLLDLVKFSNFFLFKFSFI